LIKLIIDSSNPQEEVVHYYKSDDLFSPYERRHGLPIGNLTSQFFANIYLNEFDHFVKETLRCRYYIRYVDDFVALDNDRNRLHWVKNEIIRYLERLRLRLHPRKCHIFPVTQGTNFLGYRIFSTHRLLNKDNIRRLKKRLSRFQRFYAAGMLALDKLGASIRSWIAHAIHADTYKLRKRLLGAISFCRQGYDDGSFRCVQDLTR
jgi:retron-type reverse transcriptase